MLDAPTFAGFLGTTGAVVAGGVITLFVSVIKTYLPFTQKWDGMVMTFIAAVVLYLLTGFAVGVPTLDAGLGIFTAWLACLASGIAGHKVVVNPIVDAVQAAPKTGD